MLRLIYTRKKDQLQAVSVLGDPEGIRDLYWQLTRNHQANDGTAIDTIRVVNLDGIDCTDDVLLTPHGSSTHLSSLQC